MQIYILFYIERFLQACSMEILKSECFYTEIKWTSFKSVDRNGHFVP